MTPGQTRVLVLLLVLVAAEIFLHPQIRQSVAAAIQVQQKPSN